MPSQALQRSRTCRSPYVDPTPKASMRVWNRLHVLALATARQVLSGHRHSCVAPTRGEQGPEFSVGVFDIALRRRQPAAMPPASLTCRETTSGGSEPEACAYLIVGIVLDGAKWRRAARPLIRHGRQHPW